MNNPEPAWSYSALKNYETCAKRYFHYNVEKDVKEPETEQLRQGNELHRHFEHRIAKGARLPLGYGQYEAMLARIAATRGEPGVAVAVEQKLAITQDFQPSGYFGRGVWFRTVVDCAVVREDGRATIFDWKTGKPNEDKTQLQLMAAATFIHQPHVQRVRAALVFVGHTQTVPMEFVREDLTEIWSEILPRVRLMQRARATQEYPPKPSGLCKKYCAVLSCPYHGRGA